MYGKSASHFHLRPQKSISLIPNPAGSSSSITMAPLTSRASTILHACPRQRLSALPASICSAQRRGRADIVQRAGGEKDETPHFESPFRGENENPTTKIPSFANYMSKKPQTSNKVFQYFMVGSMGLLSAAGAKATVQGAFVLDIIWADRRFK